MRRASLIQKETDRIMAVEDLTAVFEAIASTQIAKVKDKVVLAEEFFDLLWKRYSSIRVDTNSRITSRLSDNLINKTALVIISAETGLSGDIDQRLIESMLNDYHSDTHDIVVLGTHGANQLKDRGIPYVKFYKVPESDTYIDVGPVINSIKDYARIKIFYEVYISLGVQEIKTIDLFSSLKEMSQNAKSEEDTMSDKDTIFEPSLDEIAEQMELGMMNLAFSQAILESSLAQAASRFNAMAAAKKLAWELVMMHKLEFHRAKRSEADRRLREVLIGIKKKKARKARMVK
jgi:F-type H+-transporting ATPase subunit gamma